MIALIVAAIVFIPMVAILAAIALPAYQDYTLRARVASAMPLAAPLKAAVAEHFDQHQTCPSNDDSGFGPAELREWPGGRGDCRHVRERPVRIELMLTAPGNDKLDGKAVWFEYDASTRAGNAVRKSTTSICRQPAADELG